MEKKRRVLICFSSRCLKGHFLATAELIQHVVLLIWQALLVAICDPTVTPTHATLFCMLLTQLDLGIMCVHLVQRLVMSVAVMHNSVDSGLMQALQCMQQRKQ